jgi:hypothetical protein
MTNDELMTKPEWGKCRAVAVVIVFGICHFVIPSAFDIRASSLSHALVTPKSKSRSNREKPALEVEP